MQPCLGNEMEASFRSKSTILAIISSCESLDHWYHTLPNGLPLAFSSMIYSAPTAFDESEDDAYMRGIWRSRASHSCIIFVNRCNSDNQRMCYSLLTKWRVATSDAVVKNLGPALGLGIFAKISIPSSIVRRNALLNWPSTHFKTLTPAFARKQLANNGTESN